MKKKKKEYNTEHRKFTYSAPLNTTIVFNLVSLSVPRYCLIKNIVFL